MIIVEEHIFRFCPNGMMKIDKKSVHTRRKTIQIKERTLLRGVNSSQMSLDGRIV